MIKSFSQIIALILPTPPAYPDARRLLGPLLTTFETVSTIHRYIGPYENVHSNHHVI